jgi:hypothetical protein
VLSLAAEKSGTRLYDYRFEPPWPDRDFRQLPTFDESHTGEYYCLPGGLEYPREEVLNLNFLKAGWRLPCTRIEGVLCALSATTIPEGFKHGVSIPVGLKFFGRSGQQLAAADLVLWADRWREPTVIRPCTKPPVAMDLEEPSVVAPTPGSRLYGPSGGYVAPTSEQRREDGRQIAAGDPEGSPRTDLSGE